MNSSFLLLLLLPLSHTLLSRIPPPSSLPSPVSLSPYRLCADVPNLVKANSLSVAGTRKFLAKGALVFPTLICQEAGWLGAQFLTLCYQYTILKYNVKYPISCFGLFLTTQLVNTLSYSRERQQFLTCFAILRSCVGLC